MISVVQEDSTDPMIFNVTVEEQNGNTQHLVTMSIDTYNDIFNKSHEPKACITAAFKFLLERESKESIMSSFDITIISDYFPEFTRVITSYME